MGQYVRNKLCTNLIVLTEGSRLRAPVSLCRFILIHIRCFEQRSITADFLKTLFKGNNFAVWRERVREGQIRFLSPFWVFDQLPKKIKLFAWWHLFRLVERIIFNKKLFKTNLPFRFCKIGLRNTFSFGWQKNSCLLFVLFCFVATCPILAYFFIN